MSGGTAQGRRPRVAPNRRRRAESQEKAAFRRQCAPQKKTSPGKAGVVFGHTYEDALSLRVDAGGGVSMEGPGKPKFDIQCADYDDPNSRYAKDLTQEYFERNRVEDPNDPNDPYNIYLREERLKQRFEEGDFDPDDPDFRHLIADRDRRLDDERGVGNVGAQERERLDSERHGTDDNIDRRIVDAHGHLVSSSTLRPDPTNPQTFTQTTETAKFHDDMAQAHAKSLSAESDPRLREMYSGLVDHHLTQLAKIRELQNQRALDVTANEAAKAAAEGGEGIAFTPTPFGGPHQR